MTASKNPVREFIEILRRIRPGHENLKVASGIPGFIPGTGERVDAFSTALPWESATPDGLFTLKGDKPENPEGLGFAIEIFPQTGVTSEMEKTLIGLAAPLEAGSVLSITAFVSSAVRGIAELMVPEARVPDAFPPLSPEAEGIIDTATNWAAENLVKGAVEQLTPQAPVYPRHWRVWLTVVIPTTKPNDEEVREKVLTARRAISAVLEQAGLFMGVWDADVLVGTAAEILNPQLVRSGDFVRPSANPFEPPSVQVMKADTEVTVEKHRIRFETLDRKSAVHAVGLGVEHYGGHISLALASQMLGELGRGGHQIPCPFLFTCIIAVLDSASERVKAEGHRMRALQMSHTPVSQISPWYPEKARQWTIAVNSFQTEGGIARVAHQYVLLAPAGLEAEAVHAAQSIARKAGMDVRRTTCLHAQALMGALPMCAGPLLVEDMKRSFRIQRRTLATGICGSPVMTEWQGTPIRDDRDRRTPLLTLVGRRGQIMHVDPFANASGNYSVTIVGKPGSGKSVVMNQLAFSCLAQGGLVWIIDVGRSYEKTCAVLDGAFLVFDKEHVWDLNPFAILEALAGDDRSEGIESVVSILGELVSPGRPLPDLERSVLIQLTASAAQMAAMQGRLATLADLDALLAERAVHDRRLDDLRMQLEPYLNGPLARWFDGSGRPIDFCSRLTVLELEGLSAHPALRQAVLMTLMLWIEKTMSLDRRTVKLVLIDEAWDLMGSGHSGKFIASGFRRARKHKGGFVVATQSLADFFKSETAEAAWSCADTRIYLRQDAECLSSLEAKGQLATDPWFRAALPSLTTVRGAWSEMIVKVGDAPPAIGRLVLDRFMQVLYSSLPAEVSAVNAWREAGATMAASVTAVANGAFEPTPEALAALNRNQESDRGPNKRTAVKRRKRPTSQKSRPPLRRSPRSSRSRPEVRARRQEERPPRKPTPPFRPRSRRRMQAQCPSAGNLRPPAKPPAFRPCRPCEPCRRSTGRRTRRRPTRRPPRPQRSRRSRRRPLQRSRPPPSRCPNVTPRVVSYRLRRRRRSPRQRLRLSSPRSRRRRSSRKSPQNSPQNSPNRSPRRNLFRSLNPSPFRRLRNRQKPRRKSSPVIKRRKRKPRRSPKAPSRLPPPQRPSPPSSPSSPC